MAANSDELRNLPAIGGLLEHPRIATLAEVHGSDRVKNWTRDSLSVVREQILKNGFAPTRNEATDAVVQEVEERANGADLAKFSRVINATGIILHTGLGRAPLVPRAMHLVNLAAAAGNVEIDLATGDRRFRGYQLCDDFRELTGCDDVHVVNNNAAATLLALQSLCAEREVIISRGQLIEIGGSFRLPEIFAASGAIMREVGTTNRTTLADYKAAISENTAAILRVHPSNYRVVGFSETPDIADLAKLAHRHGLLCIDDIGSGSLVDVSAFGLPHEPTFPQSIAAGADVVLGSGDKLLGGPQAGILIGRRDLIAKTRSVPLARAVRIDKLTLAALSGTLECYRLGVHFEEVPTLCLLSAQPDSLRERAKRFAASVSTQFTTTIENDVTCVGGGSVPGYEIPTVVVALVHAESSPDELAQRLRTSGVMPRINQDRVLLDFRSVLPTDDDELRDRVEKAIE